MTSTADGNESHEIVATRRWLERAVIGLNLCPFAKAVHIKQQIRFVLSDATTEEDLLTDLGEELRRLQATDPAQTDTTLLIHPQMLTDFFEYNEFLELVDGLIVELGLEGELQVASFHPNYQFAATAIDDPGNCTNRAPYPTLHLLREDSLDKAVAAYPDADIIVERNLDTMARLGREGFRQLVETP